MAQKANPSLGDWIGASRRRIGWTQTELGRYLDVSQGMVSHWETGKSTPGERERATMERLFSESAPKAATVEAPAVPGSGGKARQGRKKVKTATTAKNQTSGAIVGYEAELWRMAYALRGSMDAAEYKHVVLGLIFLKYISDAFEEQHAKLVSEMYFKKIRPSTTCLYSAASIEPRRASAIRHSSAS